MKLRKGIAPAIALATLIVGLATRGTASRPAVLGDQDPAVTPFRASGIYNLGERAGWTVMAGGSTRRLSYRIKANNREILKSGDIDLAAGRATIEVLGERPEMLYLEIDSDGGIPRVFGAAIAPTKLRPVMERPKDFDSFWKAKITSLEAVPANPILTPGNSSSPDIDYATIRMDHVKGTHVYGQFAKPKKPGKYPAMLVLQWASPPYPLQKAWVEQPAMQGFLTLNIEPHDVLPTEPPSYYAGLPPELRNYQMIGQDDREKSYFVDMYLRDYRAVDYLVQRPDWDGKTLIVTGTSMGGQQSLAVAGLHPRVTHVIVEEPAGCDLAAERFERQGGYPFFPAQDAKVMEAARYVDCVNFAPHIKATCLVAMGFVDTIAPPAGIWTAFNLIRGRKEVAPMPEAPHNNTATREQQRPYFDASYRWTQSLARSGKVEVHESFR